MLSNTDLKTWLHRDIKQLDKLLIILVTFDKPAKLTEVKARALDAGLKIGSGWNPSSSFSRSKGMVISVPGGWEITEVGKAHLSNLGVSSLSPAAIQVASDLREHLQKIKNESTRAFAEEAMKCHEAKLFRSAIVMSWLAAVDVLHKWVAAHKLAEFNAYVSGIAGKKWKTATNADGLSRMSEEDFLNSCAAIGVIGKNQKEELLKGLKLRNGCGHPNSLNVGQNTVAAHIEILLLNVFDKFQV